MTASSRIAGLWSKAENVILKSPLPFYLYLHRSRRFVQMPFVILKGARHSQERVVSSRIVGAFADFAISAAELLFPRLDRDRSPARRSAAGACPEQCPPIS